MDSSTADSIDIKEEPLDCDNDLEQSSYKNTKNRPEFEFVKEELNDLDSSCPLDDSNIKEEAELLKQNNKLMTLLSTSTERRTSVNMDSSTADSIDIKEEPLDCDNDLEQSSYKNTKNRPEFEFVKEETLICSASEESNMSDFEKDSSDESLQSTPPKLQNEAESAKLDHLPTKSQKIYESTYDAFVSWKRRNGTKSTTENIIMAYFHELNIKYKPSTLWSIFSMLKATLKIKDNVDIDKYSTLKTFMKKQSRGFESKKSEVFSAEEVENFLEQAPDKEYLVIKVALIFGISGACRSRELVHIKLQDITKQGNLLVVKIPSTKTKKARTFVVAEEFIEIVQKYMDLRPVHATTDRFFLNYQKGKCTNQVIGIHKFSNMPKKIATFLQLENTDSYTGHAFRRTSAILLAHSGANITTLKRHGGWRSSTVTKGYIGESIQNKTIIEKIISSSVNIGSVSAEPSNSDTDAPSSKRQRIETITSEAAASEEQSSVNIVETPQTNAKYIFKNCNITIYRKK